MAHPGKTEPAATALTEEQRQSAMGRFAVLRPHLEEDVPLAQAALHAGVSVRTAERWLSRYRQNGLAEKTGSEKTGDNEKTGENGVKDLKSQG